MICPLLLALEKDTAGLLPGKFQGWRSLVGYSPWDCRESDTTEQPLWFTGSSYTWFHRLPHTTSTNHQPMPVPPQPVPAPGCEPNVSIGTLHSAQTVSIWKRGGFSCQRLIQINRSNRCTDLLGSSLSHPLLPLAMGSKRQAGAVLSIKARKVSTPGEKESSRLQSYAPCYLDFSI